MPAPITVLVVDEDRDILDLTKTFLERADGGLDVALETDPETAIGRAESEDVDCIVSDYRMPGLSGLDLHAALSDADADVGFVLFTAAAEDDLDVSLEEVGIDAYVRKGTGIDHYDRLAEKVRETVG